MTQFTRTSDLADLPKEFAALLMEPNGADAAGRGDQPQRIQAIPLGYYQSPTQLTLSYSRLSSFSDCPRKYQLNELRSGESRHNTIHTGFGHGLAAGVQQLFKDPDDLPRAMLAALQEWSYPFLDNLYEPAPKKSFDWCILALQKFHASIFRLIQSEYKLATIPTPIETFVLLNLGDSHNYQMHIDALLQNRITGALTVLEIKTSGASHDIAKWSNASQSIGYYAAAEVLNRQLGLPSAGERLHLVLNVNQVLSPDHANGFVLYKFPTSHHDVNDFLLTLALTAEQIARYKELEFFPKNGGSCTKFGTCPYYGKCDHLELFQSTGSNNGFTSLGIEAFNLVLEPSQILNIGE